MRAFIALLLILNSLSLFGQSLQQKFIEVSGRSEKEIQPDNIELTITIRETENVKKENQLFIKERHVLEAIRTFEIPESDIYVDKIAGYRHGYIKVTSNKYQLSKVFKVSVGSISKVDDLIIKLFEAGADNVQVTDLKVKDIERYKTELARQAIANAKEIANGIAEASDAKLGKIIQVIGSDFSNDNRLPDPYGFYRMENRQSLYYESSQYAPGVKKMVLIYSATVRFELM